MTVAELITALQPFNDAMPVAVTSEADRTDDLCEPVRCQLLLGEPVPGGAYALIVVREIEEDSQL